MKAKNTPTQYVICGADVSGSGDNAVTWKDNRRKNMKNYCKVTLTGLVLTLLLVMLAGCGTTQELYAGGSEKEEPAKEGEITVSTVEELLEAVQPGAKIILEPGRYDLSAFAEEAAAQDRDFSKDGKEYADIWIIYASTSQIRSESAMSYSQPPVAVRLQLEGLMENAGMKVLGYFTRGPRYITSNKKIETVADCQNLLIRTPQSPMTVAAFEALGSKPTPMALAEVFTSLNQGTIEAQENPYAMIYNQSFYEVQKYLINTAHLRAWVYIAMGKAQFDALPEDLQQVVLDGGKHAQDYEHELFLENEKDFEQKLKDAGMEFIDVDQKEFADTMVAGVLPILTDSQKALYEEIAAVNPAKRSLCTLLDLINKANAAVSTAIAGA